MNSKLRFILPITTFVVLLLAAFVTLLILSKKQVPQPSTVAQRVIPSPPPQSNVKGVILDQPPKSSCLPTSDQFLDLKQCSTQHDCSSCSESPMSCVAVGSGGEVGDDMVLDSPVTVKVPVSSTSECSGHGSMNESGVCVCDGEWEDGRCVSGACFRGESCELGEFSVTSAGQYCLPSYMGQCDEFTSDTVLSTDANGDTTWTCRCKQEMAGLFTQTVEGGSCNVELACGAALGVSALVNVGSLDEPVYEEQTVYPNRLTSYSDESLGSDSCVYKTQVKDGNVVPDDMVDPTCVPRLYSNKCTINTGESTQVIRGSNMPGDPEIKRASPPFYVPVPLGLNRCPDGWSGSGTETDPCTDGSTTFSIFTEDGGWLGPEVTSLAELKTWWSAENGAPWWGVNAIQLTDVRCAENVFEQGSHATAASPDSALCVDAECTSGLGRRKRVWDGVRDGPLVDEEGRPHWVTDGSYGGQCACDGDDVPSHSQAPDPTVPESWWSCVRDTCPTPRFPDAHLNTTTNNCECGTPTSTTVPFDTGMSYKHPNAPATCVKDPCNPMGVNVNSAEVSCTAESDCGGVCLDEQCYVPTRVACRSDIECSNNMFGVSQTAARCVIPDTSVDGVGTCVALDVQRAQMGSTCSSDQQCSLGACVGEEGEKTCTGGCACASGYHQETDGGLSPLGFTCKDDCAGKCKNGGTCVHLPEGGTECRCTAYYGGETCEDALCSREFEYCDEEKPCCSSCPCGASSEYCCNRFPLETTAGGNPMKCVSNVCQEDPSPLSTACASDANGCHNIPGSYFTETPPDCNGWGIVGADGVCVCHPSRTGDLCQVPICSRKNQACGVDTDCCNACSCPDSEKDCCPTYDAFDGPQKCVEGTCQVVTNPDTESCKTDFKCDLNCYPMSGSWTVSLDGTGTRDYVDFVDDVALPVQGVHFEPDTDVLNGWVSVGVRSLYSAGVKVAFQSVSGGVEVNMGVGFWITYPTVTFVVQHEDSFLIKGASYDSTSLCMASPFAGKDGTDTFFWFSANPNEVVVNPYVCSPVHRYISMSVTPNIHFPDIPHQLDSNHEWLQRGVYVGGIRTNPLEIEAPNEFTVFLATGGTSYLDHSGGDGAVQIRLIDLVKEGFTSDPGVLVTLEIGEWVQYTGQGGLLFSDRHRSQYTVPGAYLTVDQVTPMGSQICLPAHTAHIAQNPDEELSYIRFGY